MNKTNQQRIDDFLDQMEEALPGPDRRKKEIRDEVESDLLEMIEAGVSSGQSEDAAVDSAIEEMGNPFEVAHKIGRVVPPASHTVLKIFRYVAAIGIASWTFYLSMGLRCWDYGLAGTGILTGVLLFHIPAIVLAWPGIVWRKNWLFGLLPAGLAIFIAFFFSVTGVSVSSEMQIPLDPEDFAPIPTEEVSTVPIEQASAVPIEELPSGEGGISRWIQLLLLAGICGAFVVILLAIQQSRQRRLVFGVTLLAFLSIEVPVRVQESRFRADWRVVREWVDTYRETEGSLPTTDQLRSAGLSLHNESFSLSGGEKGYSLFWHTSPNGGSSLVANSRDDSIRVQD